MWVSWWMWVGACAVVAGVASGLHWTVLDFLIDRLGAGDGARRG